MSPRIMIVAGEASGDLHGANLVRAARELSGGLRFYGVGGDGLLSAGVDLLYDLESMSLMGLTEILSGLGRALRILRDLRRRLLQDRPAALVLIDYPDFNLALAKTAHQAGIPVFYYVCPQIWAWRTSRVRKMGRRVDHRVVLFPFEVDFYQDHGLTADFVGHPLLDVLGLPRPKSEVKADLGFDPERPLLLLMPGSRKQLVTELMPLLMESAATVRSREPGLQLALARAATIPESLLGPFLAHGPSGVKIIVGRTNELQNAADLAVVASGTSTLETALMLTPMVVVYRVQPLSALIGRLLIKSRFVALPNLIAGRQVVPELLQTQARPPLIAAELFEILNNSQHRQTMLEGLKTVRERLGRPGAAERAAGLLLRTAGLSG